MKQWEYRSAYIGSAYPSDSLMHMLQRDGSEGWELVTIVSLDRRSDSPETYAYFKREIPQDTDGERATRAEETTDT